MKLITKEELKRTEEKKWFSFSPKFSHFSLQYNLAGYFDARHCIHVCLGWGGMWINLPFSSQIEGCEYPSYGVYYYESEIWLCLGDKRKVIPMPWKYKWFRTSELREDGTWETESKNDRKNFYDDKWKAIIRYDEFDYTYVTEDGKTQYRIATVKTVEMEWRPVWFMWTSLFSKTRKSIDIQFNTGTGEGVTDWKGGVYGIGYEMKENETPEQTLRRMEKEKKL